VKAVWLAFLLAGTGGADLKRAKDHYEFGAYADAAGAVRQLLAAHQDLTEAESTEAYRLLGLSEYQLGDQAAARAAFLQVLSLDPDHALDSFLVPPKIVEFFDQVKRDHEPELAPLRERKRQAVAQERQVEEARRKLLAEEQARAEAPTRMVRVQEHIYLINWMPFGAGQFQNGERTKGTVLAVAEVLLATVNLGAILIHNQIATDPSRRCSVTQAVNCSNPPISDSDRQLLHNIDIVKYVSAGLFWGAYAYGVVDAHVHYLPRVETEITPSQGGGSVKLSWSF
jgi:tetratricopeptide (TPR) repeat protein